VKQTPQKSVNTAWLFAVLEETTILCIEECLVVTNTSTRTLIFFFFLSQNTHMSLKAHDSKQKWITHIER
jgi:hypothetical protein